MLRRTLLTLMVTVSFSLLHAQDHPYRVVFDLTSRDTLDQMAVMRLVREITSANPKAELEVVMYGRGFELVMPEKSKFTEGIREVMKNPNVTFKACRVALKNNNVDPSRIMKEAQTVPDGVYEIISKQREGWGYIKVGH